MIVSDICGGGSELLRRSSCVKFAWLSSGVWCPPSEGTSECKLSSTGTALKPRSAGIGSARGVTESKQARVGKSSSGGPHHLVHSNPREPVQCTRPALWLAYCSIEDR